MTKDLFFDILFYGCLIPMLIVSVFQLVKISRLVFFIYERLDDCLSSFHQSFWRIGYRYHYNRKFSRILRQIFTQKLWHVIVLTTGIRN